MVRATELRFLMLKELSSLFANGAGDYIQFRHYMSDIFNGLITAGLSIQQVQDSPHYFKQNAQAQPGKWTHWLTYVGGFAIVAGKE